MIHIPLAALLGLFFGISEIALSVFKRADAKASTVDQGSLRLLWMVILISMAAAFWMRAHASCRLAIAPQSATGLGAALFVLGLALRWCAIAYLGRLFTVNVAIAADHRVIDTGPYRWIRHPSYTGALLAFAGLGLCLENWASFAIILVPTTAAFLKRITVEEAALSTALGADYRTYQSRTKRLIPGVY